MQLKGYIIILAVILTAANGYAQRVDFEYNDFGERVLLLSSLPEPVAVDKDATPYNKECKVISIHPNPVTDYLEIQLNKGIYKITISDVAGKMFLEQTNVSDIVRIPLMICSRN